MKGTGLLLKRHTSRKRYSSSKTLGSVPVNQLPDEYLLVSRVLDQGFYNTCTAFSAVAARESRTGKGYVPQYFFAQEMAQQGVVSLGGVDLKTLLKTGAERNSFLSLYYKTSLADATDSEFADPRNWPDFSSVAEKEEKYFWCDGFGLDMFDRVRIAMWVNRDRKVTVLAGARWHYQWNVATGIIPETYNSPIGGHAFKIAGWKQINGQPHLVIQNSWGMDDGDSGLFYMSRTVANKALTYGAGYWLDLPPELDRPRTIGLINSILEDIRNLLNRIKLSLWKP